jgi:hypothetical protein
MEKQKCTEAAGEGLRVGSPHQIRVTDAALRTCSLAEVGRFVAQHDELDRLPCAFTSENWSKVMVETTEDGSATLVFLPGEREEALRGLRMRELNEETALA